MNGTFINLRPDGDLLPPFDHEEDNDLPAVPVYHTSSTDLESSTRLSFDSIGPRSQVPLIKNCTHISG